METGNGTPARRHHTVPRFYLQGFADDKRIATMQLPGDRTFTQSINNASVAKDFYSLPGHEQGDDVIEKGISEVEGKAADVLKRITNGSWPLPYEDRMLLGFFISLQAMRVPIQRQNMDFIAQQILRLEISTAGRDRLRKKLEGLHGDVSEELVDDIWHQATRDEGPPIHRPKAEHIKNMIEFSGEAHKYIVGRPWTLTRFNRRSLITSDTPVALIRDPQADPDAGVGFMTAGGITFPLTRKLGLFMGPPETIADPESYAERVTSGYLDEHKAGTTYIEKYLNYNTAINASESIFYHPQDKEYIPRRLPGKRSTNVSFSAPNFNFDTPRP